MPCVQLTDISKSFGSSSVIDSLSLSIPSGSRFFLIGPSGCGKTTLLRIIAGLETPDTGSVRFDERDVTSLPPEQRSLGYVFQNHALWPHMSVAQNVAFPLEMRGIRGQERTDALESALALVSLREYASRYPYQLSGGQQQRVALARALASRPSMILFDEPFSSLDATLRQSIREELRRIHEMTRITMIFVSHDPEDLASLGTHGARLDRGKIVAEGNASEVRAPHA